MDVILLTKVANLGNIGDRVKVKSGYGRNFLLPKGKATLATPDNVKKFEARRAELEKIAREQFQDAESRAAAFKDFKLQITAKAGTEGKLFGSIGTADIAEACTKRGPQAGARRSASADRPAAHGWRSHDHPASAHGHRRAAAGGDHRRRLERALNACETAPSRRAPFLFVIATQKFLGRRTRQSGN